MPYTSLNNYERVFKNCKKKVKVDNDMFEA